MKRPWWWPTWISSRSCAPACATPARARKTPPSSGKSANPGRFHVSDFQPGQRPPLPPADACAPIGYLEEVYRALVLGARDYVRKSGFGKVVIGLSGGIDSALTAAVAVGRPGAGKRGGRRNALPLFLRGQRQRFQRTGRRPGHRFLGNSHRTGPPSLYRYAGRPFPGHPAQRGRGKRPGSHSGQRDDDHFQQVRLAGPHHRQQERDGDGLRHPLRRHGRWVRRNQRRSQDPGLPTKPLAQREWQPPIRSSPKSLSASLPAPNCGPDQTDQDTLPPYEELGPHRQSLRGGGLQFGRDGGNGP